jgi:DNA-directed RNA polymerase subunit M/transcription elongation factor TFIIS
MRFCDVCESRLKIITSSITLYYECPKCKKRFNPRAVDTLMGKESYDRKQSTAKYDTLLKVAAFDNANPKEFKECPKCKNQITTYVIIGENLQYVSLCTCGHRF